MSYLLDTHALVWSVTEKKRLSSKVRNILEDPENTVLVSAVSFWEVSLKFSLSKLSLQGFSPEELPGLAAQTGFELIPLAPAECATYHQLADTCHKDPFDRMLIWQAIRQNLTLVSKDTQMTRYRSAGLKVLW